MRSTAVTPQIGEASTVREDRLRLVLDLDHSLLRTNLTHERALAFVKGHPLRVFFLLLWILKGRSYLKGHLSERVSLDYETLPANEELAEYAASECERGRQVVLATAADMAAVDCIARRFPFINRVIAFDGRSNLKGENKAQILISALPGGFVYAGSCWADLPVWRQANGIILVEAGKALTRAAAGVGEVEVTFPRTSRLSTWLVAARVHQWFKNSLIFVPLLLGGRVLDIEAWVHAILAFLAFSILASAAYLINDLWDINDDRLHWSKHNRPLAAGRMAISEAVILTLAAFPVGAILGSLVNLTSAAVLSAYWGLSLTYSFALKREPVFDVFTLASLFTLRLVLGITAVGVPASPWLLVFSMFLFTSLSLVKRQIEVQRMSDLGRDPGTRIAGRGYFAADAPFILATGMASGMASVLIMVLYLTQEAFRADFYADAKWLWVIPAMLFLWIARIWLLCQRGKLHDDPVLFAIRDYKSLGLCGCMAIAFVTACFGMGP